MLLEDYVVIDLEMTGLQAKTDRILEVGAARVRAGKVTETMGIITNPGIPLSEKVIALTGITQEEADAGADLDETVQKFLEFCGEDVLVGQNIIFDYSFLKQWAVNHKMPLEKKAVDTLKLSRHFLPEGEKKNLEALCEHFGIVRKQAHRALDDALATSEIFEKLKEIYGEKEPEQFMPKQLQYKAKKQTPATERQKKYLRQFAAFYQIELTEPLDQMTRSEVSRLTDKLIAQYGSAYQEWAASSKK